MTHIWLGITKYLLALAKLPTSPTCQRDLVAQDLDWQYMSNLRNTNKWPFWTKLCLSKFWTAFELIYLVLLRLRQGIWTDRFQAYFTKFCRLVCGLHKTSHILPNSSILLSHGGLLESIKNYKKSCCGYKNNRQVKYKPWILNHNKT